MGEAAWRTLGDVAQLPEWNKALAGLGDRYVTVQDLLWGASRYRTTSRRQCRFSVPLRVTLR
jgi:hypothetical protein